MSDFDLAQALDRSSPEGSSPLCDSEENVERDFIELSEDLELEVTHNRKTMRSIANLVLAVNKLSKTLSQCGRDLSDDELCGAIMGCVVEESIFQEAWLSSTGQENGIFQLSKGVECFKLCDKNQKDLLPDQRKLKLQAITLKGGECDHKVSFEMRRCQRSNSSFIVLLSLRNNLHISCSKTGGKVSLNLEKQSEEDLRKISKDGDLDRFLFIKTTRVSLTTFESVKYPSWFISTSSEDRDRSVEMCQIDSASRVTSFKVL